MSYRINKYEPDRFEEVQKGISTNFVDFKFSNNLLKIEWIQSDKVGIGSDMVLNLIDHLNAVPDKIYGRLSTTQAHLESGWRHSIPFYCKLGLKIQKEFNLSDYEFILYDDMLRQNIVFTATNGEIISNEFIGEYTQKHTEGVNYDGFFVISLFDQCQSFDNSES